MVQLRAKQESIVIRTLLMKDDPAILAHEFSLKQIVSHLLVNAMRVTSCNRQIFVSTLVSSKGEVVLRVRDTGEGIDKYGQIFYHESLFNQSDRLKRGWLDKGESICRLCKETRINSVTLGLSFTKALVEAHGAIFSIRSSNKKDDKGTLVEIFFPKSEVMKKEHFS